MAYRNTSRGYRTPYTCTFALYASLRGSSPTPLRFGQNFGFAPGSGEIVVLFPLTEDILAVGNPYTLTGSASPGGGPVQVFANAVSLGFASLVGSTWTFPGYVPAVEGAVSITARQGGAISAVEQPFALADVVFSIDASKPASYTAVGTALTSLVNLKSGVAMPTIVGAPTVETEALTGHRFFGFNGTSVVTGAEAAVVAARNGTDKPGTFFCVHKVDGAAANPGCWLGFGDGGSTSNLWGVLATSQVYFLRTSGSIAQKDYYAFRNVVNGITRICMRTSDGLTYALSLRNRAENTDVNTTAGVITSNRFAVGAIPRNINDFIYKGRIYQQIYCSTSKSAGVRTEVDNRLALKWAAVTVDYFGDSLTQIDANAPLGGWRYRLAQWCVANEVKLDNDGFILSVTGSGGYPQDLWANGMGGFTVQDVALREAAILGAALREPDNVLVFVWAGVNNVGAGTSATGLAAMPGLLNDVHTRITANHPTARICVLNLIPCLGFEAGVTAWNAALPAIWDAFDAAHPANPLLRVDANAAVGGPIRNPAIYVDGTHINEAGNQLLFDNGIKDAVAPYLLSLV